MISLLTFFYILTSNIQKEEENTFLIKKNETNKELINSNKEIIAEARKYNYEKVPQISANDYVIGSATATVELVIYDDYADPFLAQLRESINKVRKNFSEKIIIAKRFYLYGKSELNIEAVLAAICAGEQKKFWQMDELLIKDSIAKKLNKEKIFTNASILNLNTEEFNDCFTNKKIRDKIINSSKAASQYGVSGVPTIFINGEYYPGAYPFVDFTDSAGYKRKGLKSIITEKLANDL